MYKSLPLLLIIFFAISFTITSPLRASNLFSDSLSIDELGLIKGEGVKKGEGIGSISGEFNVNEVGAATYTIPIEVAPGTAGLQPSLSIVYNSILCNGIMGLGWGLSGLSEINRVGQTIYHDNNISGVNLNNTDRFSLDGGRLIAIAGDYGSNLTTYSTEIENKMQAHIVTLRPSLTL